MSPDRLQALLATYRGGLLNDTLPFWIPRAIDHEHGGYLTALDQDGSPPGIIPDSRRFLS